MALRNTTDSWGSLSRVIHWLMGLSILGMLVFGFYIANLMKFTLDTLWVYQIHKSIGVTLLVLVVVRIIWHRISPPPAAIPSTPLQDLAAKLVHLMIYALLLAIPLTGWIASAASGIDTVIWGVTVPRIAPVSQDLEHLMFEAHEILTRILMGLVVLHIGGALTHKGVLKRMISGRTA
jgi:cytochrome b561